MAKDEQQRREMGARIKELREARGLTQQHIADAVGVTLRQYQFWQAGDNIPGQAHLEKLAAIFDVTPTHILRGTTPRPFSEDGTMAQVLEHQRLQTEAANQTLQIVTQMRDLYQEIRDDMKQVVPLIALNAQNLVSLEEQVNANTLTLEELRASRAAEAHDILKTFEDYAARYGREAGKQRPRSERATGHPPAARSA